MDIRKPQQLQNAMNIVIEKFLERTSLYILEMLQNRIVEDTYAYDYYPNKYYAKGGQYPTREFYNAWDWTKLKKAVNGYTKMMFYNYADMSVDSEPYGVHSDIDGNDMRKALNEILNTQGLTSPIGVKQRKPYWDNFVVELEQKAEGVFFKELNKLGLKYGFKVYRAI